MFKLGTLVRDNVTGLKGMLTQYQVEFGGNKWYLFQPRGLNPEDGQPVKRQWITVDRIEDGVAVGDPGMPLEVLGTDVKDEASGFSGKAIAVIMHISGCVHVLIQPPGQLEKTKATIDPVDFDIRRLSGKAIPKMTEEEKAADQQRRPSPVMGFSKKQPACGTELISRPPLHRG